MVKDYERIRLDIRYVTEDVVTASQGVGGAENDFSDPFN